MSVKFAPCSCSAGGEDWTLVDSPKKTGAENTRYRCETCGKTARYTIDPFTDVR